MCDGKRVDEIESKWFAAARACRVVSGVSSLEKWRVASGKRRDEDRRISVGERRQREVEERKSGGAGQAEGLERHRS